VFDKDRFIEECKSAVHHGQAAVREIVTRAVSCPEAVVSELGEPTRAGVFPLYQDEDVTVINFIWAPYMTVMPHNHNLSAVIGIYGGREDNIFWQRLKNPEPRSGGADIRAAGAKSLGPGQVETLGPDVIHSVANPIPRLTAALHVYSGNFFDPPSARSQWDHMTLAEQPWNVEDTRAAFADAERRFNLATAATN
jgi:predicted metal-dependent enzyme (double-stranded beta helix superfamily)